MQYQSAYQQTGQSYMGWAIAGFICAFVCALLGLIFSIVALNGMKKSGNQSGHGLAIAGIVIAIINMVLGVIIAISNNMH